MIIRFLGTGTSQGVPVIACGCEVCASLDFRDKRLRSSIYIETDKVSLNIDTGPDFRQQMLRERINRMDAILFTHEHKDHTAGLDDVRSFNFHQQRDMPIYAEPRVIDQLKREFAYAFTEIKYPGVPQIEVNTIDETPFSINDELITPIRGMHYKLPVLGFRVKDFTYITDVNYLSDESKEKIKGSEVIVLNALQKTDHISHFTLDEAVGVIKELRPKQAYLTHISHKMGKHSDVGLPENITLAYDGLKVTLG